MYKQSTQKFLPPPFHEWGPKCSGTCFSHGQVAKVSLNHELEERWCPLSSKKQRAVKGLVQTAAQLTIERSEKGKLEFPTPRICLDGELHSPRW